MVRALLIMTISLLTAAACHAQVSLTFAQQGAASLKTVGGKKIKGVGLVAVVVKNHGEHDLTLEPGDIYIAAGKLGLSFILPDVALSTVAREKAYSLPALALDGAGLGSQVAGLLNLTKTIKMSNGWVIVLTTVIPTGLSYAKTKFAATQPVDSVLAADLLQRPIGIRAGGSSTCLIVTRYAGNWLPKETQLQ